MREAVEGSRAQFERERETAIAEAVRTARSKWLEEKKESIGTRVEAAVTAAQRLWREHHNKEMERVRAESKKGSSLRVMEEAMQQAVAQAKKEWMREHGLAMENALRQKQEVTLILVHRGDIRSPATVCFC